MTLLIWELIIILGGITGARLSCGAIFEENIYQICIGGISNNYDNKYWSAFRFDIDTLELYSGTDLSTVVTGTHYATYVWNPGTQFQIHANPTNPNQFIALPNGARYGNAPVEVLNTNLNSMIVSQLSCDLAESNNLGGFDETGTYMIITAENTSRTRAIYNMKTSVRLVTNADR